MPVGGWNGGHNGPDGTPPFHQWQHLTIDEQIQRAKDWRAQHSTNFQPAVVSTASTPARSSPPRALEQPCNLPLSAASPYPDRQLGAQRGPTFGGHRIPDQPTATQQLGNSQDLNGQAFAHWHPGIPQGIPNQSVTQSVTTLGPRVNPTTTDAQQRLFERESSFEEDYKLWESQVVHGQSPVPTGHILVPRVPAPGPPTTPFYVSPPPATTRNDGHSIASQAPTSSPTSSVPLRAFESLAVQPQPQHALSESPSLFTASSVPGSVQAPRIEGQTSPLETIRRPAAIDRLSGPGETGAAIESTQVNPGVGDEPGGSPTGIWTLSDDPGVQRVISGVEAQVEELEFQPLTAPVREPPPPPPSDTEAVSKKTARNRAKKARQKANKKAKKAAATTEESGDPEDPEDHTDSDRMKDDGKRKATEDPASPAAAKRVKHDDSAEPPPKPKMAVIPFPEKVCVESDASPRTVLSMLTLLPACSTRGACRRYSIPRGEQ